MLLSIACILAAFLWLMIETKDLSVNLCGKVKPKTLLLSAGPIILALPAPKVQFDAIERPYSWKTGEQKENCLMLCQNNWNCAYRNKCRKVERWTGWKIPARKLSVFGSTLNLNSQCNIARAFLLRDMAQAQKPRVKHIISAPYDETRSFIEHIRTGSEKVQHGMRGGRRFYQYDDTYETRFLDNLAGKDWLEAHHKDELPESTIDISAGGKTISINGNYKPGMIKEFVKANRA